MGYLNKQNLLHRNKFTIHHFNNLSHKYKCHLAYQIINTILQTNHHFNQIPTIQNNPTHSSLLEAYPIHSHKQLIHHIPLQPTCLNQIEWFNLLHHNKTATSVHTTRNALIQIAATKNILLQSASLVLSV